MADDKTVDNEELEHTAGGATTRDGMDAGVPMTPGKPDERVGPEDALGPGQTRGDYRDRIDQGPHLKTEVIPVSEREPDGPTQRLVPADGDVAKIGDVAGKGGVDTVAANRELATATAAVAPIAPTAMRETHEDGSGRAPSTDTSSSSSSSSS